jgi:ligand-binding sensor domain-containing protein
MAGFTRFTVDDGLPSDLVWGLADDGEGVWVGTSDGLARVTGDRVTVLEEPRALRHMNVSTLRRAPDGALWVSGLNDWLYRVAGREVTRFVPPQGLSPDSVESLFIDRGGETWAGTSRGGLLRYATDRFTRYAQSEGLPGGRVAAIAEGPRGERWLGSDGGLAGSDLVEVAGFYAYDPAFSDGVFVAAGDVTGDGIAELITGAGPGGGPHVRVWSLTPVGLVEVSSFFAYDPAFRGGVRVGR